MLEQWLLLAAFFTGFLRNFVRILTNKTHIIHRAASYLFAVLYGILFTIVISLTNTTVAALWLALVIALIIANRMNGVAHILALATVIAILGVNGLEQLNWVFFAVFILVALADEFVSKKQSYRKDFPHILMQFVGLQIVALIVSIFTGVWMVFFSIVLYDIGFLLVDLIVGHTDKKTKKKHAKHTHRTHEL